MTDTVIMNQYFTERRTVDARISAPNCTGHSYHAAFHLLRCRQDTGAPAGAWLLLMLNDLLRSMLLCAVSRTDPQPLHDNSGTLARQRCLHALWGGPCMQGATVMWSKWSTATAIVLATAMCVQAADTQGRQLHELPSSYLCD